MPRRCQADFLSRSLALQPHKPPVAVLYGPLLCPSNRVVV
jgi:hypothetical protein